MKWKEVKIISLHKMFMLDDNELPIGGDTVDYVNRMWAVANEAISIITSIVKPIQKELSPSASPYLPHEEPLIEKYKPLFTPTTNDDYVIPLDTDLCTLLPLYIASQLYKDDDIQQATIYRNEFDTALNVIASNYNEVRAVIVDV